VVLFVLPEDMQDKNFTWFKSIYKKCIKGKSYMTIKKAVAYVRVSSKSDAQMHSFDYQNEYWKNYISRIPDNQFCGIYADKGISGKSISNRPNFLRMIKDAKAGKIDIIYTKSVARFGRNTQELLKTVQELRDIGVKVFFEKEQIDTLKPNSDLFLTVAAAVAENDLRIYSANQRWSIREKFAKGFISIGNKILGYRMDPETNTLIVIPEEAETVRYIFEQYINGLGETKLANKLTELGKKNKNGNVKWNKSSVAYILKNEKYIGDALSQKTIKYLGEGKLNKGEAKQYYVQNAHEPIVSREMFKLAQEIRAKRRGKGLKGKKKQTYTFSHLIECGNCGARYARKVQNSGTSWATPVWVCYKSDRFGKAFCNNLRIKDSVLKDKFVDCYNEFVSKKYESDDVERLNKQFGSLLEQEQELNVLKINGLISLEGFKSEVDKLREEMNIIRKKIDEYKIRGLTKNDYVPITQYDDDKVIKFIEKVTILNSVVTFHFINGVKISRPYDNGPSGNQKGWKNKRR
jgi:DNA invertase Pin-like site-specific DNA recombinase